MSANLFFHIYRLHFRAGVLALFTCLSSLAGAATSETLSFFPTSTAPAIVTVQDTQSVELGVKFRTATAGTITGLRFYKGAQNTGAHTGHLWSSTGSLLGSLAFTNGTASGWQDAQFSAPISVTPGTTYVASYFAPGGQYSANSNYFTSDHTAGVLTAPSSASSGGNGVYRYTVSPAFPTQAYNATNYWVDVLFTATSSQATTTAPATIFSDAFESALPWTRTGDTTWYTGTPKDGTHSVRLRTRGAIQKTIPTTGYREITVSFRMGAYSLDSSSENVQALYYNGTSWTVFAEIRNNTANENNRLNPYTVTLPAAASNLSTFGLRFKINGSNTYDYGYVDDVVVGGTTIAATPSPTANLTASPASISAGEASTLSWTSTDATSCTGTGFSTGNATSGSVSVSPATTTTYTLACTGASGTATDTATATVEAAAPAGLPTIGSCTMFTADDEWNRDVSGLAVNAGWTQYFNSHWGTNHAVVVFGARKGDPAGMPWNNVPEAQPPLPISWTWPPSWGPIQTDPGPYPFPGKDQVAIQAGDPYCSSGSDCHILTAQQGKCKLYEGYGCRANDATGGYSCVNGAVFDLTKNSYGQRPNGWTSSDAAGLPVLPGLIRYDEVAAGEIKHALRFQTSYANWTYIKPASHGALPGGAPGDGPPMGTRIRLKQSYDISGYSQQNQVILRALKKYGAILSDNNYPNTYYVFQADVNTGWSDGGLYGLWNIPNSAFEVVTTYQ